METALIVSNLVLWGVVLILLLTVFALARQIGILHERIAPAGALMSMDGPKVGESFESMNIQALSGPTIQLGGECAEKTLIYFLSPKCPICKSLLPVVRNFENEDGLRVIFASDGENTEAHELYAREQGLASERYVVSQELGLKLGVDKLPYAALIDEKGTLRGRGLVNNREHLESLMQADELSVASLQEYMSKKNQQVQDTGL